MKKTIAAGLGACAIALAFAAKDPVIMKVNGVDVPKSEFEYLYNKNSQQQINPQTLDEYVEMFKLYKMKVADARAEGIDTTAAFIKETEQYRHDLAAPYLADSLFLNKLVKEAYDRSQQEAEAYHIMLFKTRDAAKNVEIRHRADSILNVLKKGGDFADLAQRFSQDRSSNARGGRMGWIVSGVYPINFEEEAWTLPEGVISDEIVESPVGYHILKGGKHRKARGKVQVAHILKLTQGKSDAEQALARHQIDSIAKYVMANPDLFQMVASKESEDRGSARQGGMLPYFGAGEMVEQFDSAAFAMKDGEISAPVQTAYGYHIIKRFGSQETPSFNEIKTQQLARFTSPQDPRYALIRDNQIKRFEKKHKGALNANNVSALTAAARTQGLDSLFFADWTTMPKAGLPLITVGKNVTTAGDFVKGFSSIRVPASDNAADFISDRIKDMYGEMLTSAEEADLEKTQADYRNLLKEYVDGSLLYEVSVRKVWDKAAKDTEGLQKYFEKNRSNYKWTEPHAKGVLVQAANDSVAALIKTRAAELGADTLTNTLRKEFNGQAQFDRVLVSKGTNKMVDYLLFGGEETKPANQKYNVMFMINPRIITEPEEVSDVKGLVTSDYQNEYQEAWENELRSKYPVTVNEKVLKQVKKLK